MAVTEITKILFRRGREADRRTLESFGGLAQGEPGFTSSAGWSTDLPGGGAAPNRYYIDSGNNIRSMELHPEDVITWGNNGGGDFFIGGSGGSDVYIGGASAEKHWQRYFVSLRGTKCNTTWENNTDTAGVDGFVDGTFEIGRAGYGQSSTNNDLNDEWDVNLWGFLHDEEIVYDTDKVGGERQHRVHWDASIGKLSVHGAGALTIPVGTVATRPGKDAANDFGRATTGDIRFNQEWDTFEGYFGDSIGWGSLGGALSQDRQTYMTVDAMGGDDGCTASTGWVAASADQINFVVDCKHAAELTKTQYTIKNGIKCIFSDITDSTSNTTGAVQIAGGAYIQKKLRVSSTSVGNSTGGAIYTAGGVFANKNFYANSTLNPANATAAAAIQAPNGGAAIGQDLHVGQDIVAFSSSDMRLKDNVVNISQPTDKIKKLNGVEFDWNTKGPDWVNDDDPHDVGLIAQQVEQVLPEAVITRASGYKAVDYKRVIPLLVESIKELTARVEQLEQNK